MPYITTILDNEVGVQHQGVQDASIFMGVPVTSGLIVGKFKRGRFDRPMMITSENIRGMLGHDPDNPDYIAVVDALAAGVPSVEVLRYTEEKPVEFKPMIVGNLMSSMAVIQSGSPLSIDWSDQVIQVAPVEIIEDDVTGNPVYYYAGVYRDTSDLSMVRISIKHEDGVSPINTINLNYIQSIYQWYDGGYETFMDHAMRTNGLGNYVRSVPDVAPPNTVTYDGMFYSCYNMTTDISVWDVREAETMNSMLYGAAGMTSDLSKWCVPKVTAANAMMFNWSSPLPESYLPVWGTCPNG